MLLAALTLAGSCGGGDLSADAGELPSVDLSERPQANAPDPADRAGAASHFVNCQNGLSNGGWSLDFGAPRPAPDARGALDTFLEMGLFGIPRQGYEASGQDTDRILFTYSVEGVPKVAIVVADTDAIGLEEKNKWIAEAFATCDPAEYDPSTDKRRAGQVWVDREGERVLTSIITSFRGSEHCGWGSLTYLVYKGRQYISDPRGLLEGLLVAPFDNDADLPSSAVDTGFRHEDLRLWVSADLTVAYLVSDDRVEAWPSPASPDPILCA